MIKSLEEGGVALKRARWVERGRMAYGRMFISRAPERANSSG